MSYIITSTDRLMREWSNRGYDVVKNIIDLMERAKKIHVEQNIKQWDSDIVETLAEIELNNLPKIIPETEEEKYNRIMNSFPVY